ncbi:peptidyl-prolyl cis-trans isomerase [Polaribacter pacificus]|uniref:Peptidyl-prolyl cis-trans isomerase n=1 Tax=Polaribacter pacificus TaxID=1775173 RepID=A0A917I2L9_9FLAO|nr:peptidylprolyl isomerase [Polaribacter pacificus]GGH02956.1 peptidyl-prolyl cis-trans isomerase [Polaribacter pacificus]
MKSKLFLLLVFAFSLLSCDNSIDCKIETTEGTIIVALYPDKAPITVANFLRYVDGGLYTDSSFFRVTTPENEAKREVKIEVIQGGIQGNDKSFPPIKIETTQETGILHEDGTLSMARSGPNTATNNFFICINPQPALDFAGKRNPDGFGFAAFGKVTKGMDIVRKIQSGENRNQQLLKPVIIKSIKRVN